MEWNGWLCLAWSKLSEGEAAAMVDQGSKVLVHGPASSIFWLRQRSLMHKLTNHFISTHWMHAEINQRCTCVIF